MPSGLHSNSTFQDFFLLNTGTFAKVFLILQIRNLIFDRWSRSDQLDAKLRMLAIDPSIANTRTIPPSQNLIVFHISALDFRS